MDSPASMLTRCVKNTFIHVGSLSETEQIPRSSSCPPGMYGIMPDAGETNEHEIGQSLSVGSAIHFAGDCKPCAWRWKTGGCANKLSCRFCHICPDGALKKRRRAKLQDVKEAARSAAAQKEEEEQALKAAAAQRKQKHSPKKPNGGHRETFKLSAVSLEDLFHELRKRNEVTCSRSGALSWSSVSSAPSPPHDSHFTTASSLSTASPRSLSPFSNSSAFDSFAAKEPMRPWNRDRASRDLLRATHKKQ